MKLTTTHMFLIGAAVAMVGAIVFTFMQNSRTEKTIAQRNTAIASGNNNQGVFQSLFNRENAAGPAAKPGEFVAPVENRQSADFLPVKLANPRDLDPVIARYPFLRQLAADIDHSRTRPDIYAVPSSLAYAEFTDSRTNARILLTLVEGSDFCGAAGCYTQLYVDNGGGFDDTPYSFTAGGIMVYRNEKTNGFTLFNCNATRVEEFRLNNGVIVQQTPASVTPAQIPGCTQ